MDQAIRTTLAAPSSVNRQLGNDTFAYKGPIQIKNKGKVVKTYTMLVSVGNQSWNIVTAYPMG